MPHYLYLSRFFFSSPEHKNKLFNATGKFDPCHGRSYNVHVASERFLHNLKKNELLICFLCEGRTCLRLPSQF